jgi:signal transduction histidine kinase
MALVVGAALVSTLLSAGVGVASLWAGGVIPGHAAVVTARAWWIGDMLGDLAVAPLLFVVWSRPALPPGRRRGIEAAAIPLLLAGCGAAVFGAPQETLLTQTYMLFPVLALAAWRFGPWGAAVGVFLTSAIAVAGTALGRGPFVHGSLSESLLFLQIFMGVAALTTLLIGAAVAERNRAIEARDDFLAVAAHELFTPLTALSLQVQHHQRLLEKENAEPGVRAQVDQTWKLVGRLARLIRELLDISRISAGRLVLQREDVDLSLLIRESVARLESTIANAGCAVSVVAEAAVQGNWDRSRLDQVIDNLINNALKFGAGKPVEVFVEGQRGTALLQIRDHGIGIEPGDQARIFERFERAASARSFGGLGLGLWIVRRVVEAHGGKISLSSRLGEGSTFTVSLPR